MNTAILILRGCRLVVAFTLALVAFKYAENLDYGNFVTMTVLVGVWLFVSSIIDVLSKLPTRQSTDSWDWDTIEYRTDLEGPDRVTATLRGEQARLFVRDWNARKAQK